MFDNLCLICIHCDASLDIRQRHIQRLYSPEVEKVYVFISKHVYHSIIQTTQQENRMPIQSKRVNLSILPAKISKIMDAGRVNRLQVRGSSLSLTRICTDIVYFFLEIHADADVQTYLKKDGGTLFDLIRRAIKRFIESENQN